MPWDWFRNYIQDRKQCVELITDQGQVTSQYKTTKSGVPQGSILGPLLFNIFVITLESAIKHCSIHYYADDVQLKLSFKVSELDQAVNSINEDLNSFYDITMKNGLKINATKTEAILIGNKKLKSELNQEIVLKVKNEKIKFSESVKNLGVVMDDQLTYKKHVTNLCQSAYAKLRSLYHLRNYISKEAKLKLSDSLVLSRLNYCDAVYGPCITAENVHKLQKVQNSCVRFALHVPYRDHISPYLSDIGWMDMRTRRWVHLCCLVYKVIKSQKPEYLSEKLEKRSEAHTQTTRRCNSTLSIPVHSTAHFKNSFSYQAANIYNQIPDDLKNLSYLSFKSSLINRIKTGSFTIKF